MKIIPVDEPFRQHAFCQECCQPAVIWLHIGLEETPFCGLCVAKLRNLLVTGEKQFIREKNKERQPNLFGKPAIFVK